MIKFLFLTIPNQYTYEHLKNPISFKQDIYGVTTWTMKHPLTIFSGDLKMKHVFKHNEVKVEAVTNPVLEQKWRYFVITKKDGGKYYCTSQIIYQKGLLRSPNLSQSQFFGAYEGTNNLSGQQYYLPRCIVLISQLPYFKLQVCIDQKVNLLKIHKELKKQQPAISHCIEEDLYEMYLEYLQTGREKEWQGLNINDIKCKRRTYCPLQLSFSYYVQCCNNHDMGECIYIQKTTSRQVLHLYKLYPSSLYQIGYFFHLPLSAPSLRQIISGILTEKQIVFSSSNANLTVMVIETLMQMILPLKWCYMYAPNLPVELIQAAQQSFMPYIVGISKQHLPLISKTNKIIVHIDTDEIQSFFEQQQQQLRLLSKKFQKLLQWKSNSNKQYLQWQKQLRINSILLITTIFKKDLPLDKEHYEKKYQSQEQKHSQQKFYEQFLSKSMMYRKLIEDLHEKVYSEFYKLTKMDYTQRRNFLINKFNSLHSQTIYPTKSDNKKQWIKYYEKYMRYKRKSRLNRHSLSMVENSLNGIGSGGGGSYPMLVPFYASNVSYGLTGVGSRVDGNNGINNNISSSNNLINTNTNINNTNVNTPHTLISTIHHHTQNNPNTVQLLPSQKAKFFTSNRNNQLYQSSVSTGSYSNGLKFHLGMGRNSSKDIFYSQNISTSNNKLRKQSMAMSSFIQSQQQQQQQQFNSNSNQSLQFNNMNTNVNNNNINNNINSNINNSIQQIGINQQYQNQQQMQSVSTTSRQYAYPTTTSAVVNGGNVINNSNGNNNNNVNNNINTTTTTSMDTGMSNPATIPNTTIHNSINNNVINQQQSNNNNNILRASSINSIQNNYIKAFNNNNNNNINNSNNSFMPNLSRVNEGSFEYSSSLTSTSMGNNSNNNNNNNNMLGNNYQQYTSNNSMAINNATNTYGGTSQINYSNMNVNNNNNNNTMSNNTMSNNNMNNNSMNNNNNNNIHYHPLTTNPIPTNSPSSYMMFANNNNNNNFSNNTYANNNNINKSSHNSMIFTCTNTNAINANNNNINNNKSNPLLNNHPLNQSMVASFIFNNNNPHHPNIPTSPIINNNFNINTNVNTNINVNANNINSSSHRNLPSTQSTITL